MRDGCMLMALAVSLILSPLAYGDDPVFSGPQVSEGLPPLIVTSVLGKTAGQEVDFIKLAESKPVVLVFVHARTRPAFGLTNMLMRYTATRAEDGLQSGVVFLTDDATKTEQWIQVVKKHFSLKGVMYGISRDGIEGPGSYGLNRNMSLTVLVGKEGVVSANFALVQPSVQADGPKILKAIVDALGGGDVPRIADLQGMQNRKTDAARMKLQDKPAEQRDPKLRTLLRAVINKTATADEVALAATQVEEYVQTNEMARQQLGQIARKVVDSGKLANYGTEPARKLVTQWATKYAEPVEQKSGRPDGSKDKSSNVLSKSLFRVVQEGRTTNKGLCASMLLQKNHKNGLV